MSIPDAYEKSILLWARSKPKMKRKERDQLEIQRLERLIWALVKKAGGRVELDMTDLDRMPARPKVKVDVLKNGPAIVENDAADSRVLSLKGFSETGVLVMLLEPFE